MWDLEWFKKYALFMTVFQPNLRWTRNLDFENNYNSFFINSLATILRFFKNFVVVFGNWLSQNCDLNVLFVKYLRLKIPVIYKCMLVFAKYHFLFIKPISLESKSKIVNYKKHMSGFDFFTKEFYWTNFIWKLSQGQKKLFNLVVWLLVTDSSNAWFVYSLLICIDRNLYVYVKLIPI